MSLLRHVLAGKFRSAAVVGALLTLLQDTDNNVRAVAAISLARSGQSTVHAHSLVSTAYVTVFASFSIRLHSCIAHDSVSQIVCSSLHRSFWLVKLQYCILNKCVAIV